jgi:hypothetical protein
MRKVLYTLLNIAVITACSSIKTAYDYDRQVDFGKYKTYRFNPNDLTETIGQLNADRLIKAVENELAKKGFSKSESPDAIVDVHIKTQKRQEATATTTGMGGWGAYRWGGGFSTTTVNYDEYTDGTLFITLVDAASEKVVWQGTGTKTLSENVSPDKREASIQYGVEQVLSKYPPQN